MIRLAIASFSVLAIVACMPVVASAQQSKKLFVYYTDHSQGGKKSYVGEWQAAEEAKAYERYNEVIRDRKILKSIGKVWVEDEFGRIYMENDPAAPQPAQPATVNPPLTKKSAPAPDSGILGVLAPVIKNPRYVVVLRNTTQKTFRVEAKTFATGEEAKSHMRSRDMNVYSHAGYGPVPLELVEKFPEWSERLQRDGVAHARMHDWNKQMNKDWKELADSREKLIASGTNLTKERERLIRESEWVRQEQADSDATRSNSFTAPPAFSVERILEWNRRKARYQEDLQAYNLIRKRNLAIEEKLDSNAKQRDSVSAEWKRYLKEFEAHKAKRAELHKEWNAVQFRVYDVIRGDYNHLFVWESPGF